jgi:preprotein translocase subunit SecG
MMILRAILFSIEAIVAILLTGIILMQKAKGGGLGVAFGAGVSENLFGSRTGNVLTKGTVILAIIFMANTVALAILFARSHESTLMDAHMAAPTPIQQPMTLPMGVPDQAPFEIEPQVIQVDIPALEVDEFVED